MSSSRSRNETSRCRSPDGRAARASGLLRPRQPRPSHGPGGRVADRSVPNHREGLRAPEPRRLGAIQLRALGRPGRPDPERRARRRVRIGQRKLDGRGPAQARRHPPHGFRHQPIDPGRSRLQPRSRAVRRRPREAGREAGPGGTRRSRGGLRAPGPGPGRDRRSGPGERGLQRGRREGCPAEGGVGRRRRRHGVRHGPHSGPQGVGRGDHHPQQHQRDRHVSDRDGGREQRSWAGRPVHPLRAGTRPLRTEPPGVPPGLIPMALTRSSRRPPWAVLLALPAVAFVLAPVAGLATRAPWSHAGSKLAEAGTWTAVVVSLKVTIGATLLSLALGLPAAWALARVRLPARRLVRAVIVLPVVLPPVVAGVALEAGLRSLDVQLEDAARTLGASRWYVFRRVTLPLLRPHLVAGLGLAWARALGEFGATITFAGSFRGTTQTLPLAVFQALQTDPDAAIMVSVVMLGLSLVVLAAFGGRLLGR